MVANQSVLLLYAQAEEQQWRRILQQHYAPLVQQYDVPTCFDVITDVGEDNVAHTISHTAERLNAAALVLSAHGKGSLLEWLVGSVANYCAHHCRQPVVVLHGSGRSAV